MDSNKKEILTFLSDDDFNSLIVSTKSLTKGKYILYKDGNSSGTLDNHIYKDGKYRIQFGGTGIYWGEDQIVEEQLPVYPANKIRVPANEETLNNHYFFKTKILG